MSLATIVKTSVQTIKDIPRDYNHGKEVAELFISNQDKYSKQFYLNRESGSIATEIGILMTLKTEIFSDFKGYRAAYKKQRKVMKQILNGDTDAYKRNKDKIDIF